MPLHNFFFSPLDQKPSSRVMDQGKRVASDIPEEELHMRQRLRF